MKATAGEQRLLLDLQDIDTHIRQLAYAADNLPQSKAIVELETELAQTGAEFLARSGAVEDAQRDIDRIESDVEVARQRLAADEQREAQSSSAKDLQALESEITSLKARLSDLEDRELDAMQRLEDADAALKELASLREDLQSRIASESQSRGARLDEIAQEREQLFAAREALIRQIPEPVVELYVKQRDRYGIGAALLTRGISGGSGMALSESDLAKIRATPADEIVICPDSNCILVRTEESGL